MHSIINKPKKSNFLKKNKDKVIKDFIEILNIDELEAARIFDISSNLVTSIIKDKIKVNSVSFFILETPFILIDEFA